MPCFSPIPTKITWLVLTIFAHNYFSRKPIAVYADSLTEQAVRRDFYYAFSETKYQGIPELNMHTITDQPFVVGDIPVTPILVWHLKMPVTAFRFGRFTYVTDANRIEEQELNKIRGSEVLVLNALRKEKHIAHFTLEEAITLAQDINASQTYFTHISHQLGLHGEVDGALPEKIHLAYDKLEINMS
jgi:phosphoribosyl 1,2-cyclic phosphate phosphodiesterase